MFGSFKQQIRNNNTFRPITMSPFLPDAIYRDWTMQVGMTPTLLSEESEQTKL